MDTMLKTVPNVIKREGRAHSWIPFDAYVGGTKVCMMPACPGLYAVSLDGKAYGVIDFSILGEAKRVAKTFNFWFSKPLDRNKCMCRVLGDTFKPADPSRFYLCLCRSDWRFVSLDSALNMPPVDMWYDDEDLYPIETALEVVPRMGGHI